MNGSWFLTLGGERSRHEETAMTLKWIAQRLKMGAGTHFNKGLYEHRKKTEYES
ncbi:MAG: hypothetical protein HY735_21210 [Verrucomicrobia bacterium]|nr:hypothetical protein [Verrucomicrobiota bacterium]